MFEDNHVFSTSHTYITMIRNPVDIFVSAWNYYKPEVSYNMTIGYQKENSILKNIKHLF